MAKHSRRIDSTDDETTPDFKLTVTPPRRSTKTISYNEDDDDDGEATIEAPVDEQAHLDNDIVKQEEPDSDDPFAVPTSPEKDDEDRKSVV